MWLGLLKWTLALPTGTHNDRSGISIIVIVVAVTKLKRICFLYEHFSHPIRRRHQNVPIYIPSRDCNACEIPTPSSSYLTCGIHNNNNDDGTTSSNNNANDDIAVQIHESIIDRIVTTIITT